MIGYVVKTKEGYLNSQMLLVDNVKHALVLASKEDAKVAGSLCEGGCEVVEVDVQDNKEFRGTYFQLH